MPTQQQQQQQLPISDLKTMNLKICLTNKQVEFLRNKMYT